MRPKTFLIIFIFLILVLFAFIGWMGWKGYQLQKGKILVITDRKEYTVGENLRVKIKNDFWEDICFSSCYPYFLERKNGKWEKYSYVECHRFNENGYCIAGGEEKSFELTLPNVPEGLHRLTLPICIGCNEKDPFKEDKRFYSNEFWIK